MGNCLDLSGRVAVVIGATSGIGRVIAVGLAEHGADVVPAGRRQLHVEAACLDIEAAMASLEIDAEGLDELYRRILLVIAEKFGGGPVGIETLAVAVSEEPDTLTDVIEPFLMQGGFLKRTTRGRVITQKAASHLGIKLPRQQELL